MSTSLDSLRAQAFELLVRMKESMDGDRLLDFAIQALLNQTPTYDPDCDRPVPFWTTRFEHAIDLGTRFDFHTTPRVTNIIFVDRLARVIVDDHLGKSFEGKYLGPVPLVIATTIIDLYVRHLTQLIDMRDEAWQLQTMKHT